MVGLPIISSVQQNRWRCERLEQQSVEFLTRQTLLLLLQNLFIISKHPHSALSVYFCAMLLRISSPQTPEHQLSWSKPLSKLSNRHGPLLRLKLSGSSIISRAICSELQQNSRMLVEQLKYVFHITCTKVLACLIGTLQGRMVGADCA